MTDTIINRVTDGRVVVATGGTPKVASRSGDMVEEVAFFYPCYRFIEAAHHGDMITPACGQLTGARALDIQETMGLSDADPADYLSLYVSGGLAPTALHEIPEALDFVRAVSAAGKIIGLVCQRQQLLVAALLVLVLGRRLTSWFDAAPEVESEARTWISELVARNRQFFTSRKPGERPAEFHQITAPFEAAAANV